LNFSQQGASIPNQLGNEVILLSWQDEAPVETEVEIVGHRVDRDVFNLLIVRSNYSQNGGQQGLRIGD
jgi:hypothetical protein